MSEDDVMIVMVLCIFSIPAFFYALFVMNPITMFFADLSLCFLILVKLLRPPKEKAEEKKEIKRRK